jgi:hypothetical protein
VRAIDKELKANSDLSGVKSKMKKVLSALGKIGDYGVKNADKILKIADALSKLMSPN